MNKTHPLKPVRCDPDSDTDSDTDRDQSLLLATGYWRLATADQRSSAKADCGECDCDRDQIIY
jgi:hypothetical protein